jgi:hypothetical protein
MKDEALKLALEALESVLANHNGAPVLHWIEARDAIKQALAAPVQEPETDSCGSGAGCLYKVAMIENLESEVERLKAAQRQWVGLTEDEKETLSYKADGNTWAAVELAEAKLKEKNT